MPRSWRRHRIGITALLAFALAACGGGGGSTPPATTTTFTAPLVVAAPISEPSPAPKPIPAPAPKTVLIEMYGDHTMFGMDPFTGQQMPDNAPAQLQKLLRERFGDRVTVVNRGATALTLPMLIDGSSTGTTFEQLMAQSKADIVVMNFGVADAGPWGESLPAFKEGLRQFVAIARKYGKIPVLEEPNPMCDSNYPNLEQYAIATNDYSAQVSAPLVLIYAYLLNTQGWENHLTYCLYPDAWMYGEKAWREAVTLGNLIPSLLD